MPRTTGADGGPRSDGRLRRGLTALTAVLSVIVGATGAAQPAHSHPQPGFTQVKPVPVTAVRSHYGPARHLADAPSPKVTWPSGTAAFTSTASKAPAGSTIQAAPKSPSASKASSGATPNARP
ncbi:MAG TPA: hypothetical protein VIU15_42585, partial [Streptomyces sp.]